MLTLLKNSLFYCIIFVVVISIFSCESDMKDVQKLTASSFSPSGQADTIHLIYTDSGVVKATLKSPKMLDYSNLKNPFTEFPKGIKVTIYDKNNQTSFVDADYAISYKKTNIIDLQGNVNITSSDGNVLKTSQLYYDQTHQWFFTEKHFEFTDKNGSFMEGPGVDFSKDFSIFNMQKSNGEYKNLD